MILNVQVAIEHIARSSKVKDSDAINEMIWNSIDADACNIKIVLNKDNEIDSEKVTSISIEDDGEGLAFSNTEKSLKSFGKSEKYSAYQSPGGRIYHGKLGEGRYTCFSIGRNIIWESIYKENENKYKYKFFSILNQQT